MRALLACLLLVACVEQPAPSPPVVAAPVPAACPEGVAVPPLPPIVDVETLRANRDALARALRITERARAVCAQRLRRVAREAIQSQRDVAK